MIRKDKLPELLAPAGDFECLVAAVRGGADAVYIGGKAFSARAFAKNFDIDEIKRAVSYCHLHGVKLYVTMNILIYDSEMDEAFRFAHELYCAGADALIVADAGLIRLIREKLPDFELHASTQLSVHNSLGADEAYEMGCTRVVLARELSGKNIKAVTEKCLAETEVFLHGALCVCHSGQCLFSSMIGGRSGNRGECAQPCRLPYNNGKYILSLNDLSLAGHIEELIGSGVASLKIEGRMKSPDYVYAVTSIYRRLLDEERSSNKKEDAELSLAFSRSGFTDGYFKGNTEVSMTGIRTEEQKLQAKAREKGDFSIDRVPVKARAVIRIGEPSLLTLSYKHGNDPRTVTVFGEAAVPAISSPLDEAGVKERLSKTGNSFLSLEPDDIELDLDDRANMSPGLINALRRSAVERFESFTRIGTFDEKTALEGAEPVKDAVCKNSTVFFDARTLTHINDYALTGFDVIFVPLKDYPVCSNRANGVYIPPIVGEDEMEDVDRMLSEAKRLGARYALVGNISHIRLAKAHGLLMIGDFRLNISNRLSRLAYKELGIEDSVLSAELTASQARFCGGRVIVSGRIPLMLTERCFMKKSFGCENCGKCLLTDRKGVKFPMMREYKHRNIIFNSAYTYIGDKPDETERFYAKHFIFSNETAEEAELVINSFNNGERLPLDCQFRRMGKRKSD